MVFIDGRTPEQEFAYKGIEYLRTAVYAILIEAKQSGECLFPKQISEKLGIPPIQTDAAGSAYLIVNSILCALEKEGQVQRCQNDRRTWEVSPIKTTNELG